jgi:phosphate transport system protein
MVRMSIDAFVQQDPKLAAQVCRQDVEVDLMDDEYTQKILTFMIKESRLVERLHHFIIIVRNLERIADLATNIAEDIVFIVNGRVVKHECEDWMLSVNKPEPLSRRKWSSMSSSALILDLSRI